MTDDPYLGPELATSESPHCHRTNLPLSDSIFPAYMVSHTKPDGHYLGSICANSPVLYHGMSYTLNAS